MTCLKLVKRLQLPLIFRENTIFLNELTGYVELSDFHEIWPEHSLTIEERNCVGDSVLYHRYFSCVGCELNGVGKFFDTETLRVYEKCEYRKTLTYFERLMLAD